MNQHDPITDISYVSKINKSKILALIRSRDVISRAEIGKEMGLSLPTVSRLVDSLIHQEGLVYGVGTATPSRGRPPQLVKFSGEDNYVIGLTINPKIVYAVLSNLNANIIAEHRIETNEDETFQALVERIGGMIKELIHKSDVPEERVLGVGIGVGGLIDTQRNVIAYSSAFGWTNVDLAAELGQYIDLPIKFDNVARVMALGELWYGIGQTVKDFICIYLGHGIGLSAIIDGKPHYGANGMSGELGHCTIDIHSEMAGASGIRGCLESYAGGRAIAETAQRLLPENPNSLLHRLCNGAPKTITAETVAQAANEGDELSRSIFLQAAEYLGIAVANLIHLYNPQAVVIGGGVAQVGDLLFDKLNETVKARTLPRFAQEIVIQPAYHGSKTKVMGAVALILNEVLSLNICNSKAAIRA
ncbi:MAG: ROK family protein [bacterium]|nr:ROK family protein [bacterium]